VFEPYSCTNSTILEASFIALDNLSVDPEITLSDTLGLVETITSK